METARHRLQMELLIHSLSTVVAERGDLFVGGNMFVYFSAAQLRGRDFLGPDFFAVIDVSPRERKSWVVWDEGKGPDVVIELLSESTEEKDKKEKMRIYQDEMRVPEYFWYDPFDAADWAGFELDDGRYRPLTPDVDGRYISNRLGLALTRWEGVYGGVEATWIRWADVVDGRLLPTPEEAAARRAEAEAHRANVEAHRANAEAHRANAEAHRANAEARRAAAAEAEVARLQALLAGK